MCCGCFVTIGTGLSYILVSETISQFNGRRSSQVVDGVTCLLGKGLAVLRKVGYVLSLVRGKVLLFYFFS